MGWTILGPPVIECVPVGHRVASPHAMSSEKDGLLLAELCEFCGGEPQCGMVALKTQYKPDLALRVCQRAYQYSKDLRRRHSRR